MTVEKLKKNLVKYTITIVILMSGLCAFISFIKSLPETENGEAAFKNIIGRGIKGQMEKAYFMLPEFLENGERKSSLPGRIERAMLKEIPIYYYVCIKEEPEPETEDSAMAKLIREKEGTDEDYKDIEESSLDYGEDALHIENSMLQEMEKENSLHNTEKAEEEKNSGEAEAPGDFGEQNSTVNTGIQTGEVFEAAAYPAYTYDWDEKWGYEEMVKNFYAIDNTTTLKKELVDLNKLLYEDLTVDKEAGGPQILIYHTHSQEDFADSVPGDVSTTIVGAGEKLAELLREKYGFQVMHHTGQYDVEDRKDAYSNSLPEIERLLSENPTIEVVIDVHRDEMLEGKKLVMDLQGRPTARFMFFNGLSYSRKQGDIDYLENPYIQDNLAFSFQAQVAANEYYPGLARKIYLKTYRYNLHLRPKSMLIELGAQTNTVEEIMNACDPLAHILAIVLEGML